MRKKKHKTICFQMCETHPSREVEVLGGFIEKERPPFLFFFVFFLIFVLLRLEFVSNLFFRGF